MTEFERKMLRHMLGIDIALALVVAQILITAFLGRW